LSARQATLDELQANFSATSRWGIFDASALIGAFRAYIGYNEADAQWTSWISAKFRAADSSIFAKLRRVYSAELATRPGLAKRLDEIEQLAKQKPALAAEKAAELGQQLRSIKRTGGTVTVGGKTFSGKAGRAELEKHLDVIEKAGDTLTPAVRQEIIDLAEEFGRQVHGGRVTTEMKQRLEDFLRRYDPQHVATNPVLAEAWQRSMVGLKGIRRFGRYVNPDGSVNTAAFTRLSPEEQDEIFNGMYRAARGRLSEEVGIVAREIDDVFGTLAPRVSGLRDQVQVHHLLYKAQFPQESINARNLILALRKRDGGAPDELHELLHFVSSGGGMVPQAPNRWRILLGEMQEVTRKVYEL
jgi:hypothetical protein